MNNVSVQKIEITSKDRLDMRKDGITPFPFDQYAVVGVAGRCQKDPNIIVNVVSIIKMGMN